MKTSSPLIALAAACLLAATGCARKQAEDAAEATAAPQTTAEEVPAVEDPLTRAKVVNPISIELTLSPAAQQALAAAGGRVRVETIFAGDPTPESSGQTNDFGLVELGRDVREIDGNDTITIDESVIDQSRLPLVLGQPQVLVNVVGTATTASATLACPLYWETVEVAGKAPVRITCQLPSEAGEQ